jgi:hypothetical protein
VQRRRGRRWRSRTLSLKPILPLVDVEIAVSLRSSLLVEQRLTIRWLSILESKDLSYADSVVCARLFGGS